MNTLGPKPADTLLHYLPPVGWADVATKHDLDVTRELIELKLDTFGAELRAELHDGLRRQFVQLMSAYAALQAVFIAAMKLL